MISGDKQSSSVKSVVCRQSHSARAVESKCGVNFRVNFEIPAFAGNALHSTKSMTLRVSQSVSIHALAHLKILCNLLYL